MADALVEYVPVDGCRLWTVRSGSGPPLVLLHGGPGLWDDLGALAGMLDDRRQVHRYDQRGCGRSERPEPHGPYSDGSYSDGPYSIEQSVRDLDRLRDRWGFQRWAVGGHSYGVSLALAYAVAHPARVNALLLVSGTGVDLDWRDAYRAERERRRTDEQRERLAVLAGLREAGTWNAALDREFCALSWAPDFAERESDIARATEFWRPPGPNYEANAAINADWRRLLADGFAERVTHLNVPTLILHGREDPRPWSAAERLARTLPAAHLEVVDGAGHFPWVERPDETAAALRGFLDNVT